MGSYLEAYGSQEAQRAKRIRAIKIGSASGVLALILGLTLFFSFRNYREESEAKQFLQLLQAGQYQDAYKMWGCTEAHPCPNYPFTAFRDDWEKGAAHPDADTAALGSVESCGSGVMIQVNYSQSSPAMLWIERNTNVLSFSPWKECPGRHWRFGAFFKSLIGK
ncbi:MAG TPA: hypothetical protein VHD76_17305 [Bryobacteraceae bacterium]|jgi:hypothetical protein|nr:hypothetical protein [Bryobacteraceae bacterium]